MARMKIAFLTTDNREQHGRYDLSNPYFGTAMTSLLEGLALFPELIEVHVISCSKKKMLAPEKLASNIFFHQPIVPHLGWGRTLFLGCARAVRKKLKQLRPDLVHGQGTERDCSMSAVLSGYPNVMTIHGNMRVHATREEQRGSIYYKIAAALETWCLGRTDGVVAISNYTRELVAPLTRKTWYLPNAVGQIYFDATPSPPMIPRILFVGSVDDRKNPLGLIKACRTLLLNGGCTVAIAGLSNESSSCGAEVKKLASELPGIDQLGFIGQADLVKELGKSSMLVLPTLEDNCPMVVLEAMAAGVPVAASRVGGIPDLIEDKITGILFNPNVTEEITAAISRFISDPNFARACAHRAKEKALVAFSPREIASAHLEIYREICNLKSRSN